MKKIYKIFIIAFSLLSLGTGLGFGIDALETQYLQNEYAEFKGNDFYKTLPIKAKFGHYNGGVAIFYDCGFYTAPNEYYIGQYYFSFAHWDDILYYKDHNFYLLEDAYTLGLIDIKDAGRINKKYARYFEKTRGIEYISE